MPIRPNDMRRAQGLIWALEGLNVTPPKVLVNLAEGFDLLGTPIQAVAVDPGNAIIDAAADGTLNLKTLDDMLAHAAAQDRANGYRQEFRLKAERKFAHRFQAALIKGAAQQVIDGIRPQFDAAAGELTAARDAVDLQSTPQRLLNVTATTEEQSAWGRLPDLVSQVDRIAAIAAVFGPLEDLAVVDNLTNRDTFLRLGWLDPRALMCCGGDVARVTETFRQPNTAWQTSPWLRVPLELQTIASAQERYREVAESDWAARESQRSGSGTLTEHGFVPDTRPNPHKQRDLVEAKA